jgi:hypothetical protein
MLVTSGAELLGDATRLLDRSAATIAKSAGDPTTEDAFVAAVTDMVTSRALLRTGVALVAAGCDAERRLLDLFA